MRTPLRRSPLHKANRLIPNGFRSLYWGGACWLALLLLGTPALAQSGSIAGEVRGRREER